MHAPRYVMGPLRWEQIAAILRLTDIRFSFVHLQSFHSNAVTFVNETNF